MTAASARPKTGSPKGATVLAKAANGEAVSPPPPIPHITANYVPLGGLVRSLVARSYQEMQNSLRTLNSIPSDVARKQEFLKVVVAARQEFVKLYVLCKWAAVSQDISRCIDVAAWLHGQLNAFNNVVGALFHLYQSMGNAKQQHADIESALRIVKRGTPDVPTFGFIPPAPMSDAMVLDTMQHLNLLLALRLAVAEQLPPIYRNYTIQSGRARFTVPGYMWIDLGVADDAMDAQFFFVNFGFMFSRVPVPVEVMARLEQVVNARLTHEPLKAVLDWTLQFSSNYKLALINKQVRTLEFTRWRHVLSHAFHPGRSSLIVNYWVTRQGSYELHIGIGRDHLVQVRWYVDDEVQTLPDDLIQDFTVNMLNVEIFLRNVTLYHGNLLLQPFVDVLPWIQQSADVQLLLQFSTTRSATLIVDHLQGKFIMQASGPLMRVAENMLNSIRDVSKLPTQLDRLRLSVWQESISQRAEAAGWQARSSMRLAAGELTKFGPDAKILLLLRLPSWTDGWFVAVAFGGDTTRWLAARMASQQRRWVVETLQDLHMDYLDPDYTVFQTLAEKCSSMFALYELCQELDKARVTHSRGNASGEVFVDIYSLSGSYAVWASSALKINVSTQLLEARGRAKEDLVQKLGKLSDGDIKFLKNGEFLITVPRQSGGALLPAIMQKLSELDRVAKSLHLAQKADIEVREATLNEITLAYAPGGGILTVRDGQVLLAAENPQEILAPYLSPLLRKDGLSAVVELLRITFPVFRVLVKLKVVIIARSASAVVVQTGLESYESLPQLEISLRYFNRKPMLYVTGNGASNALEVVQRYYRSPPAVPGVVPLVKGVAVAPDSSELLLKELVAAIKLSRASHIA